MKCATLNEGKINKVMNKTVTTTVCIKLVHLHRKSVLVIYFLLTRKKKIAKLEKHVAHIFNFMECLYYSILEIVNLVKFAFCCTPRFVFGAFVFTLLLLSQVSERSFEQVPF